MASDCGHACKSAGLVLHHYLHVHNHMHINNHMSAHNCMHAYEYMRAHNHTHVVDTCMHLSHARSHSCNRCIHVSKDMHVIVDTLVFIGDSQKRPHGISCRCES